MGAIWKPTVIFLNVALFLMPSTEKAVAIGKTNGATQAQTAASSQGELKYKVPEGWVVEHPASSMRAAQYKLPKADGDTEDANLVLYYFGQGQGGSTEANIDRWINQMQQPDGRPSREKAKSETMTVNGLKVTTVDVAGKEYVGKSSGSRKFL